VPLVPFGQSVRAGDRATPSSAAGAPRVAAELEAFLDTGALPVYVGSSSMSMRTSEHAARVAIEAVRAQGRRAVVARGWADLGLIDDLDDCFVVGEVNHQAPFGRVADLGIGAAHDGPTPTFESLSAALSTALTPETRT
jgi:vancomycin aglycone glucosyltransferase